MAEKNVILPENTEQLIEKWLPVIEGTDKWEKVVEGMPKVDDKDYALLATQLEILEQTQLSESTVAGNIATYTPVLIPMVRRIAPAIIGGKLFGTQPMSGPSGMIFSLKSLYQGTKTEQDASAEFIIMVVAAIEDLGGDVAEIGGDISTTLDDTGVDPTEALVGTIVDKNGLSLLIKVTSGTATVGDMACFASTVTQNEGIAVNAVYQAAEALAAHIFPNFSGELDGVTTGGMTTARGETLGVNTKEMGFVIGSSTVEAKTRKLKTRWTIELEDDLRSVHGMNAEQLLSGFCGDEIVREMNREFMNKVHDYAATTTDDGFATSTWTYSATAGAQGYTENERYEALGNAIVRQSRRLSRSNQRGPATFMIVTFGVLTALERTGRYKGNANANPLMNPLVGKFDAMDVYVDMFPDSADEFVLLGYKGDEIDAGFYYCPYIPLKVNKGYGEEDNIPRLFFSTRYGMGENPFGAANYYHKMIINLSAVVGMS